MHSALNSALHSAMCCVLLLAACGRGDGPDDDPGPYDGAVVYVDQAAGPGGDGSPERPYRTIEEALAHPPRSWEDCSARIAIAAGTYDAPPEMSQRCNLSLEGAGVGVVTLVGDTWMHADQYVSAEDLAFEGDVEVGGNELSLLRSVDVRGELQETGGQSELDGVRVIGGQLVLSGGFGLSHVEVSEGGVTMRSPMDEYVGGQVADLVIRDSPSTALTIEPDVRVELRDVEITDSDEGVAVGVAAQARFENLRVYRSAGSGLVAAGATVEVTDGEFAGAQSHLVDARDGATVVLSDVELTDALMLVLASGSRVRIADSTGTRGHYAALTAAAGSTLEVVGNTFTDCPNGFIRVGGRDTTAEVVDNTLQGSDLRPCISVDGSSGPVVIRGNTIRSCGVAGVAVEVASGVTVRENEIVDVSAGATPGGAADGVFFESSSVDVDGNSIRSVGRDGVRYLLGSSGTIAGNVIREAGGAAVYEDCAVMPNDVIVGDNDVADELVVSCE